MEPVKGGTLANPPEEAQKLLATIGPGHTAYELALRFAESLPGVETVLSGMSSLPQVEENIRNREPLTETEWKIMLQAAEQIKRSTAVKCSGCGYCLKGCPESICIPNYFRLYNEIARNPDDGWKIIPAYDSFKQAYGKPGDCIMCRQCESHCPQKLPVTEYLKKVAEVFEPEN